MLTRRISHCRSLSRCATCARMLRLRAGNCPALVSRTARCLTAAAGCGSVRLHSSIIGPPKVPPRHQKWDLLEWIEVVRGLMCSGPSIAAGVESQRLADETRQA